MTWIYILVPTLLQFQWSIINIVYHVELCRMADLGIKHLQHVFHNHLEGRIYDHLSFLKSWTLLNVTSLNFFLQLFLPFILKDHLHHANSPSSLLLLSFGILCRARIKDCMNLDRSCDILNTFRFPDGPQICQDIRNIWWKIKKYGSPHPTQISGVVYECGWSRKVVVGKILKLYFRKFFEIL